MTKPYILVTDGMNSKVFEHLAPNSSGNYPAQDPTCTYSGAPQMSIAM